MNATKKNPLYHLPNALTCCNVACGCYAAILALSGNYLYAMIMILVAAGFDFFDGMAARLLNAYSPIGKDLDSLADIVSFGVAPSFMLFHFIDRLQATHEWPMPLMGKLFLLAPFAIPVFSALRLAKFNQDVRQTSSFIGLPVPAHALFWASSINALAPYLESLQMRQLISSTEATPLTTLLSLVGLSLAALITSLLLVSEIPMFSLKVKTLRWKGNETRYLLLIAALLFLTLFGIAGISATIAFYFFLSLFSRKK